MLIDKEPTQEELYKEAVKKKAEEYGFQRHIETPKDTKELEQLMKNLIFTINQVNPVCSMQTSKALAQINNFWALINAEDMINEQMIMQQLVLYQSMTVGLTLELAGINNTPINEYLSVKDNQLVIDDNYFAKFSKMGELWIKHQAEINK